MRRGHPHRLISAVLDAPDSKAGPEERMPVESPRPSPVLVRVVEGAVADSGDPRRGPGSSMIELPDTSVSSAHHRRPPGQRTDRARSGAAFTGCGPWDLDQVVASASAARGDGRICSRPENEGPTPGRMSSPSRPTGCFLS